MLPAILLAACATTPDEPDPPVAPEPAPAAAPAPAPTAQASWGIPLKSRMHEHFAFATDAVYYVIQGDLDKVKAEGAKLTQLSDLDMPEGWAAPYENMKQAATAVAESPDLDTAADRTVALGKACAGCHTSTGGPTFSVSDVTGGGWPTEDAMSKHQWAAYLMWLGIVLPSDAVFVAGTEQLKHDEAIPPVPAGAEKLEVRVHELAEKAAAATDPDTRAETFVGFLKTCAACHAKAEVVFP